MILQKVIYDGTHAGDFIGAAELALLFEEVQRLSSFRCRDNESVEFVERFTKQMRELVETATAIQKPISF
jgi:hypothetical protein